MSYCSPDTFSDYENLKEAQEQLNAIINGANEKKRMSDHLQTIIKIQSRIDWPAQTLVVCPPPSKNQRRNNQPLAQWCN